MGSHTCIALDLNPGGRGISMPPPGVVPNFAHPTTRAGSLLAINIVCLAVAGLFVAARHYSKYYLGTRKLDLDDGTSSPSSRSDVECLIGGSDHDPRHGTFAPTAVIPSTFR